MLLWKGGSIRVDCVQGADGPRRPPRLPAAARLVASCTWVVSVFVYGAVAEWAAGDWLQFVAASAWTLSNVITLPDIFEEPAGDTADSGPKQRRLLRRQALALALQRVAGKHVFLKRGRDLFFFHILEETCMVLWEGGLIVV